jgi:hypothetical protein
MPPSPEEYSTWFMSVFFLDSRKDAAVVEAF